MADGSVQVGIPRTSIRVRYNRPTQRSSRSPVLRAPFVTKRGGKQSMWDLPASDGYGTGCIMGEAAGKALMKALRDGPRGSSPLQHIVLSMLSEGVDLANSGRRGQLVGFFEYLNRWLERSAKVLGTSLDSISEADIEAAMTQAARESEAEFNARLEAQLAARRHQEGR